MTLPPLPVPPLLVPAAPAAVVPISGAAIPKATVPARAHPVAFVVAAFPAGVPGPPARRGRRVRGTGRNLPVRTGPRNAVAVNAVAVTGSTGGFMMSLDHAGASGRR